MITILLNNVDISSSVRYDSLLVVQNLTNEVNTAEFSLVKTPIKTIPSFNDDIIIEDDGETIFAGKVLEVSSEIEGQLLEYITVRCVDHRYEFDRVLASKTYTGETVQDIIIDLVQEFAPQFTTNNVSGNFVVPRIVFNQIPLSECLFRLAELVRFDWYIDEDKDVHFFSKITNVAPFNLDDSNGTYEFNSLTRNTDGSQVVNTVLVRGGEYDGAIFTDTITVVGDETKSFKLPYRFSNLTVNLNATPQIVGIDFIDDFTTADVLYNFQEQSMHFENPLSDGDEIQFSGNPKTPVLAIVEDAHSRVKYGKIEKIMNINTITSNVIARKRASAELLAFAEKVVDIRFTTKKRGLRAGQFINAVSEIRNFNDQLIIKSLSFQAITPFDFSYTVECISTQRYTLIDLLKSFLKPEEQRLDENEVSERAFQVSDIVSMEIQLRNVLPSQIEEEVQSSTEDTANEVIGEGVSWVYGYYHPTGFDDTKRMAKFDRDSVFAPLTTQTLFAFGHNQSPLSDETSYTLVNGSMAGMYSTSSTDRTLPYPISGWFSGLKVDLLGDSAGVGESITVILVVNGIETALSVVLSDTDITAENITNEVYIPSFSYVQWKIITSSGCSANTIPSIRVDFTAEKENHSVWTNTTFIAGGGDEDYIGVLGAGAENDSQYGISLFVPCKGTIKRLMVKLSGNVASSNTHTFTIYKNGSATDIEVNIPQNTSVRVNNVDEVTVDIGDILEIRRTRTDSAVLQAQIGLAFEADEVGDFVISYNTGATEMLGNTIFPLVGTGQENGALYLYNDLFIKQIIGQVDTEPTAGTSRQFFIREDGINTTATVQLLAGENIKENDTVYKINKEKYIDISSEVSSSPPNTTGQISLCCSYVPRIV